MSTLIFASHRTVGPSTGSIDTIVACTLKCMPRSLWRSKAAWSCGKISSSRYVSYIRKCSLQGVTQIFMVLRNYQGHLCNSAFSWECILCWLHQRRARLGDPSELMQFKCMYVSLTICILFHPLIVFHQFRLSELVA